jgi:hypothetical protein
MSLATMSLSPALSLLSSGKGASGASAPSLSFLSSQDIAELEGATGAHIENGRVLQRNGRSADAATTALFQGIAAARQAEAESGETSGDLSEYMLLQVKSGAYGTSTSLDADQIDRLSQEIRSGAYSVEAGGAKSDFLDFIKQSPEERALAVWLKSHNLTLDQFKGLPKDEQQSLLDKFKEDMKKEQQAKYGIGMQVDASA